MKVPIVILFKSIVKPFYKENAGLFVFVFTMLFFIVNKVDGAELFEYHYSLIMSVLSSVTMLVFVFIAWALYVRKFTVYVSASINRPEFSFLYIVNSLSRVRRFVLFLLVDIVLFLPVLLYGILIIWVGWLQHFYLAAVSIISYSILLSILPALWHVYLLDKLNKNTVRLLKWNISWPSSYPVQLIRFVVNKQKGLWLGSKVFTCGLLYLIAHNNTLGKADVGPVFLLFSFGVLSNSALTFRIREWEEVWLRFYRGLAVPLWKRFVQYGAVCLMLLLPEFITLTYLTPAHLNSATALGFGISGYSLILLIVSITFLQDFSKRDFLKILLLLFALQYLFLLAFNFLLLSIVCLVLSILFFYKGYYHYERYHRNQ